MSDLFHELVPDDYIEKVLWVMRRANWHTYQVLTKRASRMAGFLHNHSDVRNLSHIWWGVSVENKKHGLPRIDQLRKAPGAIRFLSIEPLLEDLGPLDLTGINWVIVGGESGPRARQMRQDWVISVRDQCFEMQVPFFFKQWGGIRKAEAGRKLLGRFYDEMPETGHDLSKLNYGTVRERSASPAGLRRN